jgi:hypothetical protein
VSKVDALIDSRFIFLGLCFNFSGTIYYLRKALRREIKPHLVTWFLWALAPLIAFSAQTTENVGLPSLMTLMVGVNPALIFMVSVRDKEAHWSISKFDIVCGLLSLAGIGVWIVFQKAELGVAFSILSDALASIPTIRKAAIDPKSESWAVYVGAAVGAAITLATLKSWTFSRYAFAGYILVLCFSITAVILIRGLRLEKGRSI